MPGDIMKPGSKTPSALKLHKPNGFTLLELLVIMAIIAILGALMLAGLSVAQNNAKRATCLNNLKQINSGVRMYSDDSNDTSPNTKYNAVITNSPWTGYKELMKNWVGLRGASSPKDRIFACPTDTFWYDRKSGWEQGQSQSESKSIQSI